MSRGGEIDSPLPVSIGFANYQPALMDVGGLRAFCTALEDLGYHGIQVQDHVAYPWAEDSYSYSAGGRVAHHPGQRVLEALSFLAAAATCSSSLALEASVVVLPQRHPLLVAKQAATVDRLSGGRLLLGVGPGWLRAEMAALGWDPATRGARMDEALAVLASALDEERVEGLGEHFPFGAVSLEPRPVRPSNELLWIGGGEAGGLEPAMRRLGRFGAGWIVNPRFPFEGIPAALARAADEARIVGRGKVRFGVDLNVQWHEHDDIAAVLARRRAAGATRLSVFLGGLEVTGSVDELIARATSFATAAGLRPAEPVED